MPAEGPARPRPHVIVIGGGVAGLSAATALASRGVHVTLVEARPTLGGRATSFVDPVTKASVDNGQHILMGCYDEAYMLFRRIGSVGLAPPQDSLAMDVVDMSGLGSRLTCPPLPAPIHLLAGLLRWDAVRLADALSALRLAWRPVPHQAETVERWLARMGQSRRLVEMLWEPLALAALNQSVAAASARSFAAVLDRVLQARSASALAVPRAPLSRLIAEPAEAYLRERGATIRTSSSASIVFDHSGAPTAFVRNEALRGDAIVLAVEWHALARVVVNAPDRLEQVVRAGAATPGEAIVSAHLWFDRRVMDTPFVGLPGRAWQWVFDVDAAWTDPAGSAKTPSEAPGPMSPASDFARVSMVASAATGMVTRSNQELSESAWHVLRDAVPGSRAARMLRAVVVRERRATFSVAPGLPARPGHDVGTAGLYLAGDWIGSALPATIEAAAASGHRAAELAARHIGAPSL